MKDIEVVRTIAGVRALADSTRLQVVHMLTRGPATGSMLARALNIPANRAHYHLQRLLEAGLIRDLARGREQRTEERYYVATARHILVDPGLGGVEDRPTNALRQSIETTFLDWRRSQVLAIDWGDLARLVVHRSLQVRPDDQVVVLFAPIALEPAEAIQVEIEASGAQAHLRPWSRNVMLRTIERYSLDALESLALIPEAIDKNLTAAVLLSSSLVQGPPPSPAQRERLPRLLDAVSRWKLSARQRGLRYVHVGLPHRTEFGGGYIGPEAGIDLFWRCVHADVEEIRRCGEHVLGVVRAEPEIVIQGDNDARLHVTLDASHAVVSDGIISPDDLRAGHASESVPSGSFGALPVTGTADGVFEAEYTFSAGRHIPRVRVVLREGRVVELDAAADADVVRDQLAREAGEPGVLSAVTIGLNPGGRSLSGKPDLDGLSAGVVSLHFGNNELWGGRVRSTFGLSLPAHGLTVRTRTRSLVTRGRLAGSGAGQQATHRRGEETTS